MRHAVVGLLVLSACGAERYDPIIRTTDHVGDTCGTWTIVPKAGVRQNETVDCASQLGCAVAAVFDRGAGETQAELGVCMPLAQPACSMTVEPGDCPAGLGCHAYAGSGPGACFADCTATGDCPAPYQVCSAGACTFLPCNEDPSAGALKACPADARCNRLLCDHL